MEKEFSSEFMDSDQMGLKHLAVCYNESDRTHGMASSMLSRTSSSSSSAIGDYIGTESCFDVLSDENDPIFAEPDRNIPPPFRRKEEKSAAAREFPPPISGLARTGNHPSHMPWVLTRVYTSDGRLILREEKVRHHEYFRAHRSNGRLTLQLVPLDDDDDDDEDDVHDGGDDHRHDVAHDDENDEEVVLDGDEVRSQGDLLDQEEEDDTAALVQGDDDDDDDIHHDDVSGDVNGGNVEGGGGDDGGIMSSPSVADHAAAEMGDGGGSQGGKCLKSYFLGMQVPEIRPVLS